MEGVWLRTTETESECTKEKRLKRAAKDWEKERKEAQTKTGEDKEETEGT
jgi:hypothetical protein